MLEFEGVTKLYPGDVKAVDNLSLKIEKGELVAFIGPSGCGKTTTLKMVNRMEEPSSGRILFNGQNIMELDAVRLRRQIGYVIQEIALMPHMTVAENIAIVPGLLKWPSNRKAKRVDELLAMAGLNPDEFRHRLPDELSGGQKQRIGVLRAMAAEPEVILMDEPFGALDPLSREKLQDELLQLQQTLKKTIVFVTHDMDEALKMADRIIVMRRGKIEQAATPGELNENPANDFVRNFLGEDRLSKISPDSGVELLINEPELKASPRAGAADVLNQIMEQGLEAAQVVDESGKWHGMAPIWNLKREAQKGGGSAGDAAERERKLYLGEATLRDAAEMLADQDLPIPVLDREGIFIGEITETEMARLTINRLTRRGAA